MQVSRRRIFGLLAASPIAAKAAAETAAAQLAGISTGLPRPEHGMVGYGYGEKCTSDVSSTLRQPTPELLRSVGIPDWLRRQWQERARHVHHIDPDLAAMRSLSLSGKIAAQRARNLQTIEANFWTNLLGFDKRHEEAERWRERTGIALW